MSMNDNNITPSPTPEYLLTVPLVPYRPLGAQLYVQYMSVCIYGSRERERERERETEEHCSSQPWSQEKENEVEEFLLLLTG